MASTPPLSGSSTSTSANMPGRSKCSAFFTVAWTRMLRVFGSTSESIAVISPSNLPASRPFTARRTFRPAAMDAKCCCGSENSTKIGSSDWSATITAPGFTYCPLLIWRMPTSPSNGAVSRFLATSAFISSTDAFICATWLSAVSQSDCAIAFFAMRSRFRSRSVFASPSRASAERSCASSCCVSSFTSRSPIFTGLPDSNAISDTIPARSVLTVTPFTAFSEPTARSTGCHVCGFTVTVVTAAGGGPNFAPSAIPLRTIVYFQNPTTAMNVAARTSMMSIRFFMEKMRGVSAPRWALWCGRRASEPGARAGFFAAVPRAVFVPLCSAAASFSSRMQNSRAPSRRGASDPRQ